MVEQKGSLEPHAMMRVNSFAALKRIPIGTKLFLVYHKSDWETKASSDCCSKGKIAMSADNGIYIGKLKLQ